MNLDDKSLFLDAMEDVQPLKRDVHWHPGRNSRARNASIPCSWIIFSPPAISISCRSPRRWSLSEKGCRAACWIAAAGKYSQQASLSCCASRWNSAGRCSSPLWCRRRRGLRNVLIVHGKGRDDQSHANIIRSYLARWLEDCRRCRPSAPRFRIMAAAAPAMSRCVNRRRRSRRRSSTPSAVVAQKQRRSRAALQLRQHALDHLAGRHLARMHPDVERRTDLP